MPDIAIVIASRGRPEHLRGCLAALAQLKGGPYRTIVVDDGSPEPLAPLCTAAGDWVSCIRQQTAGPAAARNAGVAAAKDARRVCFTDDDCRPRPDWIRQLAAAQGDDPRLLAGGRVIDGLHDNPFSAAAQSILTYSYARFGDFAGRMTFFTTNNMCLDRDAFLTLGGFDPSYGFASEDRDLCYRWRRAGGALRYADDAVVDHYHVLALRSFLRQQYRYGRGTRRFHLRLSDEPGGSVEWGTAGFYAGLLLHPLRRPGRRGLAVSALIGLAHAAMLMGYLREKWTRR